METWHGEIVYSDDVLRALTRLANRLESPVGLELLPINENDVATVAHEVRSLRVMFVSRARDDALEPEARRRAILALECADELEIVGNLLRSRLASS